jgi:glycosyltransferase involved in cell wall biosynthesis
MKIAIFAWNFPPIIESTSAVYLFELSRKMTLHDNDVTIFTFNSGNIPTREIRVGLDIHRPLILEITEISKLIFSTDRLKESEEFMKVFSFDHAAASIFIRMIEKEDYSFDIIALYDWQTAGAGLIIKKTFPKIPMVFHINSVEEKTTIAEHLKKKAADISDMIITVSGSMRDRLVALGYPSEKIHVVWGGCDQEKYDPAKIENEKINVLRKSYGIQPDDNVILYIGELTKDKGIDRLIQALPLVCLEFPNTKLVVVGKGELYNALTSLASRLNMTEKIIIRDDWLDTGEKILHYGLATVCAFPSSLEPFENAVLEAMAMMIPVVADGYGPSGFKEQIVGQGPNQCGLLVNGRNPVEIAKGIKKVFANKERAKKWGENGRRRVLECFTLEKTLQRMMYLYSKL